MGSTQSQLEELIKKWMFSSVLTVIIPPLCDIVCWYQNVGISWFSCQAYLGRSRSSSCRATASLSISPGELREPFRLGWWYADEHSTTALPSHTYLSYSSLNPSLTSYFSSFKSLFFLLFFWINLLLLFKVFNKTYS